jgi:hypothetical protein
LQAFLESKMATTKTATLTIRVDPNLKVALQVAAQEEHRSVANMIEVMIREHCNKHGINIVQSQESDKNRDHL